MTKYWLAGAGVFALMTGAALAQNLSSESTVSTQTTTTTPPPVVDTVHTTKTQQTVAPDGTQTDQRQTFTSGNNGTAATSNSRTTAPDGAPVNTVQRERVVSPNGDTSTTSRSTTTTPPSQ